MTIAGILRGEACAWDGADPRAVERFIEAAGFHGVLPLLDEAFQVRPDTDAWPREILTQCFTARVSRQRWEDANRGEVIRVLEALAQAGVRPLVLKGGALAHSHYAEPALRPRSDTDLLVSTQGRGSAEEALRAAGYVKAEGVTGEVIAFESLWTLTDAAGYQHRVDLHWRLNNVPALANVLQYEELEARSVALPTLGATARALAPVDALLFACIHRAGHMGEELLVDGEMRRGSDRLIWLYDIHLLVSGMGPSSRLDEFARVAAERRVRAICLDALLASREAFATVVPPRVLEVLQPNGQGEPSAYLLQRLDWRRRLAGDLLAIDGWRDRARWLSELAFPSAKYMHWKYPGSARCLLPWLYLRRGLAAVARRTPSGT